MVLAMKHYTTTVTRRGQITLPAEVRKLLDAKPKSKVAFIVDDGHVTLSKVTYTLESAFGSVKPSKRPEDFKEISRLAKQDKAERVVRRLRDEK